MGSSASEAVQRDRAALVALYAATDGANWKYDRYWLSDVPLNEWYGVTTDTDGRITALHLDNNKLRGDAPDGVEPAEQTHGAATLEQQPDRATTRGVGVLRQP